jgi:hypothetical protein
MNNARAVAGFRGANGRAARFARAHEQLHTASLHISRATDCQLLNVPNSRRFPPLVPGNLKIKHGREARSGRDNAVADDLWLE